MGPRVTSHTPHTHSGDPHHPSNEHHGPKGNTKKETKNADGSDIKRDAKGNVDNNKNGHSDGSGIDINSTRPDKDHPELQAAYDEKKQLARDRKMDALTAKQALDASLAEIKQWAAAAAETGKEN